MKKMLLIVIIILLLFTICGCGGHPQKENTLGYEGYFIVLKKLDDAHYVVEDPETKIRYVASRTKDCYYVIGCEYKDK